MGLGRSSFICAKKKKGTLNFLPFSILYILYSQQKSTTHSPSVNLSMIFLWNS